MSEIHGHEVMRMMLEAEEAFTRESLHRAILERFGPEATFYTCSATKMNAGELIEFLAARGKFFAATEGEGFQTSADVICDH